MPKAKSFKRGGNRYGPTHWTKNAASLAKTLAAIGIGRATKGYSLTGGVAEKPQNEDTRINLNDTYSAAALYTKKSRKRKSMTASKKRAVHKKKAFSKKIKKIVHQRAPWSRYSVTFTNQLAITSVPGTTYGAQDVFGKTYSNAFMFCSGVLNDTAEKGLVHIAKELKQWGHVENGAVVDDNTRNEDRVKFDFQARMEFDIQCFNTEFTSTNPLYIDIYECTAAKNIDNVGYATPADAWTSCLLDQFQPFTGDNTPINTRKGARPSDCPSFGRWWSTDKVTRVRIASPAPFHYDMTSNGVYSTKDDTSFSGGKYCHRGITKGIIIVVAPIMVTTMPANYNFQITAINKHYKFRQYLFEGHTPNMTLIGSNLATTL